MEEGVEPTKLGSEAASKFLSTHTTTASTIKRGSASHVAGVTVCGSGSQLRHHGIALPCFNASPLVTSMPSSESGRSCLPRAALLVSRGPTRPGRHAAPLQRSAGAGSPSWYHGKEHDGPHTAIKVYNNSKEQRNESRGPTSASGTPKKEHPSAQRAVVVSSVQRAPVV
jgi:hypothetical protein